MKLDELQRSAVRLANSEREVWRHSGALAAPILTIAVGLVSWAIWSLIS